MNKSRTPLRYPGGKQRLAPFLVEILSLNNLLGGHYAEPYAGGAGAAIDLLITRKVSHIHLNDASIGIYSFWYSILNFTDEFCQMIASASLTVEEWRRQQNILNNHTEHTILEVGFSTFYLNRCNRSGVISGGIIGGLAQAGEWKMDARFSRIDLIQRIEAIAFYKDKISITNMDAEAYIEDYIPNTPENTLIYFDPPYYEKSQGLYLNKYKKCDHERISISIQKLLNRNWILSYDGAEQILSYYSERKMFLYDLQYNASKVYKGKEVFIFCDHINIPRSSELHYINDGLKGMLNSKIKIMQI